MPEIVDEGVAGYLVTTVDQAVVAVTEIAARNRANCRERARQRFDADRMVTDYLAVYDKHPPADPVRSGHLQLGPRHPGRRTPRPDGGTSPS
ncbi:hypothetical protein [Polymorphospora lycopeni]|uniref:Glycosyltransferase n=1 Tax=Polymorphospora lycopeni TaxID=3140240 RepID=A0ABV5D4J0_9ACTN